MDNSANSTFIDYYALLGVEPDAEIDEIRRAYLFLAKQNHPDAGGSVEMMQSINAAYRTLTSTSAKAAYDMLHSFHVDSESPGTYRYENGREVANVSDLKDDEIDVFLDTLFEEYRNGPPKEKQGIGKRFRKFFDL